MSVQEVLTETILKEISMLAIDQNGSVFTDKQKEAGWLGNAPAKNEEIEVAESRLGVQFPDDYKNFLLSTNGFFTPCDATEPAFETVEDIDHLRNIDSYLLEIWNQGVLKDIGEQLNRAIVIGGINDEQYFLLIPPEHTGDQWKYWKFANWIPGEKPYESLDVYFTSVLEFLKS